ncbi:MAG TPA: PQQ-dependent sugar dehydrogenase [Streptosporangiaceae bacterium]|nr:PQQ-dependent sugar dehydrogenase [Streptosporangiaceae bacterium]
MRGSDWKGPAMFSSRLASLFVLVVGLVVVPGAVAQGHTGGDAPPTAALRLVAGGLTAPITMVPSPDRSGRLFVVDQAGTIHILRADGTLAPEPFLDLRDRMVPLMPTFEERGVLGLAFHPRYAKNGRLFVFYSVPLRAGAPDGFNVTSRISEFRVSAADPDHVDPATERVLLEVDKPQSNHNSGTVAFGPRDGYLYISVGDGGGGSDMGLGHVEDWYPANAGGNGQDVTQNLLGNILRIDVDRPGRGRAYGIPRGNPFVGKEGLDEIYAYGFRNPYRMSFDLAGGHDLIVGDAGQSGFEEVDVVRRGGNYGWNVKEGTHCFNAADPSVDLPTCPSTDPEGDPLIDPVVEYPNVARGAGGLGVAVIGGYVYRGRDLPGLRGRYVFGDWSRALDRTDGTLFVATPAPRGPWRFEQLRVAGTPDGHVGHLVIGLGQDLRGEIYVLTSDLKGPAGSTGQIYRLVQG